MYLPLMAHPATTIILRSALAPTRLAPADAGIKVQLVVVNRWGKKVFESQDYKNDWNAQDLEGGVYYINVKVGDLATCKSWVHIVK